MNVLQCSGMAVESDCCLHRVEGVSSGTLVAVPADVDHYCCSPRSCQSSVLALIFVSLM